MNGSALLLGMVYSTELAPKRGQEYRDRVRCEALQQMGYKVRTLDNKHNDTTLENHCNANFADTRRMMRSLSKKWDGELYSHVVLDYFMSPVGWARTRWTDPLFTETFPTLAMSGLLAPGAVVWLPNLSCIEESLQTFREYLEPYFIIRKESNASLNPLYTATEHAEDELLRCPDLITNKTQVVPIKQHCRSDELFYVLELRQSFLAVSGKRKVTESSPVSMKRKPAAQE